MHTQNEGYLREIFFSTGVDHDVEIHPEILDDFCLQMTRLKGFFCNGRMY